MQFEKNKYVLKERLFLSNKYFYMLYYKSILGNVTETMYNINKDKISEIIAKAAVSENISEVFEELKNNSDNMISDEDMLELIKKNAIYLIEQYSASDNVNHVSFAGIDTWLTPEVRSNYLSSITAAEFLGEESVAFMVNGISFELPLDQARLVLYRIQRYADACYIVTETHKKQVSEMENVEDILVFDYTEGYPEKLVF